MGVLPVLRIRKPISAWVPSIRERYTPESMMNKNDSPKLYTILRYISRGTVCISYMHTIYGAELSYANPLLKL